MWGRLLLLLERMCAAPWHVTASALGEGITQALTSLLPALPASLWPGDLTSVPVEEGGIKGSSWEKPVLAPLFGGTQFRRDWQRGDPG